MLKMIVARSNDDVIGVNGVLPWDIKEDLQFFKKITENNVVVMGSKTYESIGSKPLPNRINYVLTSQNLMNPGVMSVKSIDTILELSKWFHDMDKDVFIIGGSQMYNEFSKYADEIILSTVDIEIIPTLGPDAQVTKLNSSILNMYVNNHDRYFVYMGIDRFTMNPCAILVEHYTKK